MRYLKRKPTKVPIANIIDLFWNEERKDGKRECNQDGFVADHIAGIGRHMKVIHNIYTQRKVEEEK